MGCQLWISPETGYRRRGTRFVELRPLFERGLTLASIYEPVRCCFPQDSAIEVRSELERLDFDVAGVGDPETGKVMGWIERQAISDGQCGQYLQRIEPHQLVSDSTPLLNLIAVLAKQPWAFVVAGHGVTGIVTRADLQKPPIRALLFGIVSLLDMHLTYWVAEHYPGDTWVGLIAEKRVVSARKLLEARQARNEKIDLLSCLQFCDKRDLVIRDKGLRERLELGSQVKAKELLREAEKLRDRVAHSQTDLVSGSSWPALAVSLAKIEKLLLRSDYLVEEDLGEVVAPRLPEVF